MCFKKHSQNSSYFVYYRYIGMPSCLQRMAAATWGKFCPSFHPCGCACVCVCVHFVQASAQIDSIMKGQVRDWRANLYILARHVSKKDIPLCHNVGQLAHTHTHTQQHTHTVRRTVRCQKKVEEEDQRLSLVVLDSSHWQSCECQMPGHGHCSSAIPSLSLAPLLCWQHMRPGASSLLKCQMQILFMNMISGNKQQRPTHSPYNKNPEILV